MVGSNVASSIYEQPFHWKATKNFRNIIFLAIGCIVSGEWQNIFMPQPRKLRNSFCKTSLMLHKLAMLLVVDGCAEVARSTYSFTRALHYQTQYGTENYNYKMAHEEGSRLVLAYINKNNRKLGS
jgi:hypothetical protein